MKKTYRYVSYDPSTGNVNDGDGKYVGMCLNMVSAEPPTLSVDKLIKLKEAGFSADEIVTLVKEGVVA